MKNFFKLAVISLLVVNLFACGTKSTGAFKVVDGKEVYMEGKNQVIDKLVEVDGEKYYIGDDGTKVKNNWAVIDNDGNYAYFGAKGQMIKNQIKEVDGDLYLLGDNGILKTNGIYEFDNNKYYATNDGKLLKESIKTIDGKDMYFNSEGKLENKTGWVESKAGDYSAGTYYLDNGGQVLKNTTTPDGKKVDTTGKEIIEAVKQVTNAVSGISSQISGLGGITDNIVGSALGGLAEELTTDKGKNNEKGLWIEKHERKTFNIDFSWTSDDGDVETDGIKVVFDMPIVGGSDSEEVETYNKQIENVTNQFIEDLKNCEPGYSNVNEYAKADNRKSSTTGAITSIRFLGTDQDIRFNQWTTNHNGDAAIFLKMNYEVKNELGKTQKMDIINSHEISFDRTNKTVTFYVDCGSVQSYFYKLDKAYIAE